MGRLQALFSLVQGGLTCMRLGICAGGRFGLTLRQGLCRGLVAREGRLRAPFPIHASRDLTVSVVGLHARGLGIERGSSQWLGSW